MAGATTATVVVAIVTSIGGSALLLLGIASTLVGGIVIYKRYRRVQLNGSEGRDAKVPFLGILKDNHLLFESMYSNVHMLQANIATTTVTKPLWRMRFQSITGRSPPVMIEGNGPHPIPLGAIISNQSQSTENGGCSTLMHKTGKDSITYQNDLYSL